MRFSFKSAKTPKKWLLKPEGDSKITLEISKRVIFGGPKNDKKWQNVTKWSHFCTFLKTLKMAILAIFAILMQKLKKCKIKPRDSGRPESGAKWCIRTNQKWPKWPFLDPSKKVVKMGILPIFAIFTKKVTKRIPIRSKTSKGDIRCVTKWHKMTKGVKNATFKKCQKTSKNVKFDILTCHQKWPPGVTPGDPRQGPPGPKWVLFGTPYFSMCS